MKQEEMVSKQKPLSLTSFIQVIGIAQANVIKAAD